MTHYSVAVITPPDSKSVDTLIAPYYEGLEVDPYVDQTKSEYIAKWRERIEKAVEQLSKTPDSDSAYLHELVSHDKDDDEALYAWAVVFDDADVDQDGNVLTTYNPDSKYDYYLLIGKMTMRQWLDKDRTDESKLRDSWRKYSTEGDGFWKPEYYISSYGDEDTYVKYCSLPLAWAVVTPDGTWHEPGAVGWFGTDTATADTRRQWADKFHEKFVEPYDLDETHVFMLDCHI